MVKSQSLLFLLEMFYCVVCKQNCAIKSVLCIIFIYNEIVLGTVYFAIVVHFGNKIVKSKLIYFLCTFVHVFHSVNFT